MSRAVAFSLKPFSAFGRDLYCNVDCRCLSERFKDHSILSVIHTVVNLIGYNDDYFFDIVNATDHEGHCKACGRKYFYRWTRNGVMFAWANDEEKE